jgi:alkanesulfonate monooxygenase SsuD/methylene tetrahydromethanopterin reductase-like flavin-dependent oxidoreductase (luciferase family)
VITRLLHSDQPVNLDGQYFSLHDAILLPRPQRPGGPPILIGGNGRQRTLPLVARYADVWNAVLIPAEEAASLNRLLTESLEENGRKPGDVQRTLMTGCIFGTNDAEVNLKVSQRTQGKRTAAELRQRGLVVGTGSEVVDQLGKLAEAGIQRVMLQWLDLDDMDGLEAMAQHVLPHT